jgi:hypothetical protein
MGLGYLGSKKYRTVSYRKVKLKYISFFEAVFGVAFFVCGGGGPGEAWVLTRVNETKWLMKAAVCCHSN